MPTNPPLDPTNQPPAEEATPPNGNNNSSSAPAPQPQAASEVQAPSAEMPEAPGETTEDEEPTEPLAGEESTTHTTTPLGDTSPLAPLADKSVVGERYRISSLLGSTSGTNVYRVSDLQGYLRCWACGSTASLEGDTYCVECGAQLTGRFYRMQEFPLPQAIDNEGNFVPEQAATALLPMPVLENEVPGVAHVYDVLFDLESMRAYIIWDEVYGRTLASWLPDFDESEALVALAPPGSSGQLVAVDEPEEEQALTWMAQAADILAELHARGILGCDMTLSHLVVQPGDRLALIDLSGCREVSKKAQLAEQTSDVRMLASELETWYVAVREEPVASAQPATDDNGALQPAVDESTGPLANPFSPSMILAKAREGVYTTAEEFGSALHDLYEASRPVTDMLLWSGRSSNVGRVRQINEDSVLTLEATVIEQEGNLPIGLYVIADGMGGHQSGEVASSIAVRTIGAVVNSTLIAPLVAGDPVACNASTLQALLQQAVLEANRRIYELARERRSDLGTTVTAALIVGHQLTIVNVGDSRTYMWRDGQLAPVTRDHSLVAQLVASGQLSPEDIYTHPRRNEIYRALGDPHLTVDEVDTFSQRVQPGDGVLLCSDGLWDFVRDPAIKLIIESGNGQRDPQSACQELVTRANSMGGEDNISVIYVRALQSEAGAPGR